MRKALHSLERLGRMEWIDANPRFDVQSAANLTVDILSKMNDCKDIWSYSQWVLSECPKKAMNIFCDVPANQKRRKKGRDIPLNHEKVLHFLSDVGITHDNERYAGYDFIEHYLEHIVIECQIEITSYHDRLAHLYMKKIKYFLKNDININSLKLKETREKLFSFLSKSKLYLPEKLLKYAKDYELNEEVMELNKKLKKHTDVLRTLVFEVRDYQRAIEYCTEALPKSQERSDRFLNLLQLYFVRNESIKSLTEEKRAEPSIDEQILSGMIIKTRDRLSTIDIIVDKLTAEDESNDPFAFMNEDRNTNNKLEIIHSNQVFDDNKHPTNGMNFQFSPSIITDDDTNNAEMKEQQIRFDQGIDILFEFAYDMDFIKVLQLLPSTLNIMHIRKYLQKIIPHVVHRQRLTEIKRNLFKMLYLSKRVELANVHSNYIRMNNDTACAKCQKRIGSSVVILDPISRQKYHYSCFHRRNNNSTTNDNYARFCKTAMKKNESKEHNRSQSMIYNRNPFENELKSDHTNKDISEHENTERSSPNPFNNSTTYHQQDHSQQSTSNKPNNMNPFFKL